MSTPTDPYNSRDRAPSQAEDILAPLPDGAVPGDGPADTADGDPFDLATPLKQAEPESPTASNAPSATTATPLSESAHSASSSVSADSASTGYLGKVDSVPTPASADSLPTQRLTTPTVGLPLPESASPAVPAADRPIASVGAASPPPPGPPPHPSESTPTAALARGPEETRTPPEPYAYPPQVPPAPADDVQDDWVFAPQPEPAAEPPDASRPLGALPPRPIVAGWMRAGVFAASLALVPVAWYLLTDANARLSLTVERAAEGHANFAAAGELAGGIAVAAAVWFLARSSSLGAVLTGMAVSALGAVGILLPKWTDSTLLHIVDSAADGAGGVAANIAEYLRADLGTGRMLVFGAALLLTGLVCHSARRRGYDIADRLLLEG